MGTPLTTEQFIYKANDIHNSKYDYSLVNYIDTKTKISIICVEHGEFFQSPHSHLKGSGCKLCWKNKNIKLKTISYETFVDRCNIVHNNKYEYESDLYTNLQSFIYINCPVHGKYLQKSGLHILGHGCPKCKADKCKITNDDFLNKAKKVHHDSYDYSKSVYIDSRMHVVIICKIHGEFSQKANSHLRGSGCPLCNSSKGESKIREVLLKLNINFIEQKRFDDCKFKYPLSFDFFLPNYNLVIEYDGIQHFKPCFPIRNSEKAIENLKMQQLKDKIKNKYCIDNDINLLRISYVKYNKIENILHNKLNKEN